MIIAQVFLIFLGVWAIGMDILRYRQRKISAFSFILWLGLWTGAALIIIYPNSTAAVARFLGIGRGTDLVLYTSIITIMYLLFKVYVRLEQIDRHMSEIVRAYALREAGLGHSKKEQEDKIFLKESDDL